MPCRSDYDDSEERSQLRVGLDNVTDKLCRTCKKLGEKGYSHLLDKDVADWWAVHKAADERRRKEEAAEKERERKKKVALNKLSAEERELLGIRSYND